MASHLTPALRCRFRHTAICVFEKNYRLQDIQLSKNSPAFASLTWLAQSTFALGATVDEP